MTTTVKNDFGKDFFKKLDQIKKSYVTIGIYEDAGSYENGETVIKVALGNEFGTDTIPERSFFRSAIDDNLDKINKWREEMIVNIFENNWPVEKALRAIGLRIQVLVQNKIKSNIPPDNSPATKAHKLKEGVGQKTLIETGLMLRSVTFKVVI